MLLLVLILVLLAFGLLVVALLSGSVIAAWVSVGLSVVAALVLLVDWLQRRSAVKAGAAALVLPPDPMQERERQFDPEPATEVLPIIPPAPAGETVVAPAPYGQPESPDPSVDAVAEPRFDHAADAEQTVLMPAVQPPGSPARPSGAEQGVTASGPDSSLSVAKSGVGGDTDESGAGLDGGRSDHGGDSSATVRVERDAAESAAASAESAGTETAGVEAEPVSEEPTTFVKRPVAADQPEKASETAEAAGSAPADDGAGATVMLASGAAAAAAETVTSRRDAAEQETGATKADASSTSGLGLNSNLSGSDLFGGGEPARAEQPDDGPEESPDEPPVERSEPADAALVAGLEDEVIVIDEQPRYHVPGCRALSSVAPIPLPAREAVELGFTPCGWCAPDRTLASRHPAAAR